MDFFLLGAISWARRGHVRKPALLVANSIGSSVGKVGQAAYRSVRGHAPGCYDRARGVSVRESVAVFVLAGGKSTRMGTDKAFLMLEGRTLLRRALETAAVVADNVSIVGEAAKFRGYGAVVEDVFRDCGPLGGIHAALRASRRELNVMLAVDLPYVPAGLLQYLVERAANSSATVTVPRMGVGWQPLCAVYRCEFATAAGRALRSKRYKIDPLFGDGTTLTVTEEELTAAGFSGQAFQNLNTMRELLMAIKEAKARQQAGSGVSQMAE